MEKEDEVNSSGQHLVTAWNFTAGRIATQPHIIKLAMHSQRYTCATYSFSSCYLDSVH